MLKQSFSRTWNASYYQPPSGGCVLKHSLYFVAGQVSFQPPSGGCVLKPKSADTQKESFNQPPSGGCVLKLQTSAGGKNG